MTIDQTRQLGIEFERRCHTMDPAFQSIGKLDTEDIYSFLNQYQLQLVKQLYVTQDTAQSGTHSSNRINDYLKSLLVREPGKELSIYTQYSNYACTLPSDYFMYISSFTQFDSFNQPNQLVDIKTINDIQNQAYDQHRIIRKPLVAIVGKAIVIKCDKRFTPRYVTIDYVKLPKEFTILGDNPTPCELPMDCFEDLVTGAVELFFNYKYKIALAKEAAKKARAKKDKEDTEDSDD